MNYERHQGGADLPKVECINPRAGKWLIRWDYQPHNNEEGEEDGVTFVEHTFLHKPTLDEIKAVIIEYINAQIDERIVSGFTWNGKPVWLSIENQFNFKAAYDLAVQTEGANLPLKFKLGEDSDGLPVYHTFRSIESLADFYTKGVDFKQQCLDDGWRRKDGIDWSPYEAALSSIAGASSAETAGPAASPSGQE